MHVHRVDQYLHMVGGRELADAMSQVEDMGRPFACAGMRRTETIEYRVGLQFDLRRVGEKHRRVEIALQCLAASDNFARLCQVHRPIHAQHVAVEPLHVA